MSKPNKNRKKYYDAYKNQGRREKNKARKAEKLKKELAKYAARREDPEYQKAREERRAQRDPGGIQPRIPKSQRIGGWDSIMGKLNYQQEVEEKESRRIHAKLVGGR